MDKIIHMYNFDEEETKRFYDQFNEVKLDSKKAMYLSFTGIAHHFYLKRVWVGIGLIFLCFSFVLIPFIIAAGFIEGLFFIKDSVRECNEEEAVRIANSINLSRQVRQHQAPNHAPPPPVVQQQPQIIIKEIVKVACPYCDSLVENTRSHCPQCGGQVR
jgi:hypothetical protein